MLTSEQIIENVFSIFTLSGISKFISKDEFYSVFNESVPRLNNSYEEEATKEFIKLFFIKYNIAIQLDWHSSPGDVLTALQSKIPELEFSYETDYFDADQNSCTFQGIINNHEVNISYEPFQLDGFIDEVNIALEGVSNTRIIFYFRDDTYGFYFVPFQAFSALRSHYLLS
ncbi:MAG: hypothetical protein WCO06_02835 [Candidatus Roizmanbacteria bacterium]